MTPRELPPIVTSAQMRAIDESTIRKHGIPGITLMENAGAGIARRMLESVLVNRRGDTKVAILCGPGNNGGDGFVIARHLSAAGVTVQIFALTPIPQLKGDARVNAERAAAQKIIMSVIPESGGSPVLGEFDVIVDALFGTGFHGNITGIAADLINAANQSGVPIVSVDTPSGLDSDTGMMSEPTISAAHTFTLGASKLGQWLWPGRRAVGRLEVIDIGIPDAALREVEPHLRLITREFVREALPPRPPDAHKGTFGKALIIGGSAGLSGAVILASNACLRSGAGLAYAAVPESLVDVVDAGAIETVTRPLPEVRAKRVIAKRALGEVRRLCADVDAVAIGPGLSTHHETQELVRRFISRTAKPSVIDADGLNACAKDTACLTSPDRAPLILTPHVGEMARLLQTDTQTIARDRLSAAIGAAEKFNCIVVMKGAPTFVAEPNGDTYLNPTGNSGMATGGVGDVLTGIVVSLLAQGCEPVTAAICGVYLHGQAGDLAAVSMGQRSLVASDLVSSLPSVLKSPDE